MKKKVIDKEQIESNDFEKYANTLNKNFKKFFEYSSFKSKFLGGFFTGFGSIIGATLGIAIFLFILQQVATIEILEPIVKNIIEIVDSTKTEN